MTNATPLLRRPQVRTSLLVVALYGLLLGHLLWRTAVPAGLSYPLEIAADWITHPSEDAGNIYVRKRIHITSLVRRAWLKVAAPDEFELYVNGQSMGGVQRSGATAVRVFEIGGQLRPGDNQIAVESHKLTYPGAARIAVEGGILDWGGREVPFVTDATWRCATVPERESVDGKRWFQAGFRDSSWSLVRVLPADTGTPGLLPYPSVLATDPPAGEWGWGPDNPPETFARCNFEVPPGATEVWIEVASAVAYSAFLNGKRFAIQDRGIGIPLVREDRAPVAEVYNLTSLARTGGNVVAIASQGEPSGRRLLAAGVIMGGEEVISRFKSPDACRAQSEPAPGWTSRRFDDDAWPPLVAVGAATTNRELPTRYRFVRTSLSWYRETQLTLGLWATLVATMGLALLAWWLAGAATSRRHAIEVERGLAIQRLPFLWGGLGLGLLYLLAWDIRLSRAFPYRYDFALASVALVLALVLQHWHRGSAAQTTRAPRGGGDRPVRTRAFSVFLLLVLVAAGSWLRLRDVSQEPLTGDETTMAFVSQAVLEHGIPVIDVSPRLPIKHFTTSELIPYSMAAFIRLFGMNELGVRFNGVFFSVLTIMLLFVVGRRLFDERVGLLAAAVYALLPYSVDMSHYARYPSELQFFTLLTTDLLHRALAPARLSPRRCYAAVAAAVLMYFCWEGSAFVIPGLFLGVATLRRRSISWLWEPHVWFGGSLYLLAAFLQMSMRLQLSANWPRIGLGISEISPSLLWLEPLYDPWIFVSRFFIMENLQSASLLAAAGILFAVRDRNLSYILTILIATVAVMTNLLETQDPRHLYHLLPLLLLGASRTLWSLADAISSCGATVRATRWARAGLVLLFLLSGSAFALKLYRMPGSHRPEDARPDAHRAEGLPVAFADGRILLAKDAAIITHQPHVALFYLGRADYYLQNSLVVPAAIANDEAIAVHRVTGSPLLYSLEDLEEALTIAPRAYLAAPARGGNLISPEVRRFLTQETQLLYSDGRVRLHALPFQPWDVTE